MKYLMLIATMISISSHAKHSDILLQYELESQLEMTKERAPGSERPDTKEEQEASLDKNKVSK